MILRKLVDVRVEDLLGDFTHEFHVPPDQDLVLLYGPNGVGKTKLLELISAAASLNAARLARIPFSRASLTFDDGAALSIERLATETRGDDEEEELLVGEGGIHMTLTRPGAPSVSWTPGRNGDAADIGRATRLLEREGIARREANGMLRDLRTNEVLAIYEVLDRYPYAVPPSLRALFPVDPELGAFCSEINVHIIATQRLLTADSTVDVRRRVETVNKPTVLEFAEDLSRRLNEALASNSQTSQRLDESFPRRLLSRGYSPEVSDEDIRQKYDEQKTLRSRLSRIAVLEAAPDIPLPDRELLDWERAVLWTYLTDTDEKLATFGALLTRVDLFREIVTSRFQFKEMRFDTNRGFTFWTRRGQQVGPEDLSSGEQHELVLAYDLLFNVRAGSLVLIDEPEISLHVVWQQSFVRDILKIAELSELRFIVATHSPQIINRWWKYAKPLTPEFDTPPLEFDGEAPGRFNDADPPESSDRSDNAWN